MHWRFADTRAEELATYFQENRPGQACAFRGLVDELLDDLIRLLDLGIGLIEEPCCHFGIGVILEDGKSVTGRDGS